MKYRLKRMIVMLGCVFLRNGNKKAELLRKSGVFKSFGKDVFWYPRILPAETNRVEIHDNVVIATDVYFCTHDIGHVVLNSTPQINLRGGGI